MKIKQKLFISSTIITVFICVLVITAGIFVSKKNLAMDLNYSNKVLNQLSKKYYDISQNFISDYTQKFLKIETNSLLYKITPLINKNDYDQNKISNDKKIIELLKLPLNIDKNQVGYFALLTKTGKMLIGPPKIKQFSNTLYSQFFFKVHKFAKETFTKGEASGYYNYLDKNLSKIVKKYAVMFRIPDSDYIICGLLNIGDYNSVTKKNINEATRIYYNTQKENLISHSNKSLIKKSIFFTICLVIVMSFYIFILNFIMGITTKPLRKLTGKLKKFNPANPDFSVEIPRYSCREVIELTKAFTRQEKELKCYMDNFKNEVETRHILEHELEIAKKIQNSVLPKITAEFDRPEFSLFSKLLSAKEVAGDFYDFFYLSKNKMAFLIADVSGKGIPAALFMQRAKIILRVSCETEKESPGKALEKANRTLSNKNEACMFVTVFLVYYNLETGEISYANGGHHPTVKIADGKLSDFGKLKNIALGTFEGSEYRTEKSRINNGDTLILYTDGVTEAISPTFEEFGTSRLYKIIRANKDKPIEELGNTILKKVSKFEENSQFDDITILIFRRNIPKPI